MQVLAQLDVQGDTFLTEISPFIHESKHSLEIKAMASDLAKVTWENREKCDALIGETVKHWQIKRIALIDRSILRLAIGELLFRTEVPVKVVLDQAIEIAKKYSTAESPQFINGVLDAIAKKVRKDTFDKDDKQGDK